MLSALRFLPFLAILAACAVPPPSAYVGGTGHAVSEKVISVGKNAAGEACTEQAAGNGADIYCGTWSQPSARVRPGPATTPAALAALATSGTWRVGLNALYSCGPPNTTAILGNQQVALLQCTQLVGGWPHVAMVADVGGRAWYADGVLPALPVIERTIGVLSGRVSPQAASAVAQSAADAMLANRLAAQAFSSGDVGHYDELMHLGTRANLSENFAAAETAFRAALALQQKALGADNPNTVGPLTYLALQISDQGRYAEADRLFAQAGKLVKGAADPTAAARLLHYRALDALNQHDLPKALRLLRRAEAAYVSMVPASALHARPAPVANGLIASHGAAGTLAEMLTRQDLLTDPATQTALLGVIETRRYEAIVLRDMGKARQSEAAIRSAQQVASANDLTPPILSARLYRTAATTDARLGREGAANSNLAEAVSNFTMALPGTRPIADTQLLRAAVLARTGRLAAALATCQSAIGLLQELKVGTSANLLFPCLGIYAGAAGQDPKRRQALLAEMFDAAQLAQGGVTSQQIAQATARLSANASDPKVAAAIRRRQDASARLADLFRARDQAAQSRAKGGQGPAPTMSPAGLDKQIAAAQVNLSQADAALQAAAPNYGQLVQQVAPASQVFAALRPDEAFVDITLGPTGGWSFLLHAGKIAVAPVPAGLPQMEKLVERVRATVEPTTTQLPVFDMHDAYTIYADTLGKLAPRMKGVNALVVAPTGPLLSLPFGMLPTAPASPTDLAGAPWLIRRMTVAHVPAAANFVSLRKVAGTSRATQPWFGFGDFRPVTLAQAESSFPGATCKDSAQLFADLPHLPFATRELAAARAILGASPRDELLGPAFTAKAVLAANLKNFRILHFATHALLPTDLRCASQPAIVTSDPAGAKNAAGAMLTAAQVTGMHLDADLVILSACNTGGPSGKTAGESLSGLARAFFYAGARALLITHWSVNDQTAAYLVADMLNRLRSGKDGGVAGALRATQLAFLDQAGHGLPAELAHPFYWAPFALIGDGGSAAMKTAFLPPAPQRAAGL